MLPAIQPQSATSLGFEVVRPRGFEPLAYGFGGRLSRCEAADPISDTGIGSQRREQIDATTARIVGGILPRLCWYIRHRMRLFTVGGRAVALAVFMVLALGLPTFAQESESVPIQIEGLIISAAPPKIPAETVDRHSLRSPMIVLASAATMDWATTAAFVNPSHGEHEGNPVISGLQGRPALMIAAGIAEDVVLVALLKHFVGKKHPAAAASVLYVASAFRLYLAARNIAEIKTLAPSQVITDAGTYGDYGR